MLFSSLTFLFIFLPLVLAAYFVTPKGGRNYVLLASSIIFYAWGEPVYLAMMLFVIIANYAGALLIEACERPRRQWALTGVIVINLSFLAYFKYYNFAAVNLNHLKIFDITFIDVIMPIGISFYTFQAISYLVDVYRGEVKAQRDIYKVGLYIALFPQLVAGPIVKYHDVEAQISSRWENWDDFLYGFKRFIIGLAKKVIIANSVGETVDKIFDLPPEQLAPGIAWAGAVLYALQLYFDFSGYSDMAIGLGRMFGFKFLENFNYPYVAISVTEFWRRWHISLSTWFKQYLYIPLGGNRVSLRRTYFNLFIVFLATGVWHGAEWTFVVWGLWHGFFIILEKATGWNREKNNWKLRAGQHFYLLLVAGLGFVIFRAPDLAYAWRYLQLMFGVLNYQAVLGREYFFTNWTYVAAIFAVIAASGVFRNILTVGAGSRIYGWSLNIWLIFLFYGAFMFLAASTYNPFIYFRF